MTQTRSSGCENESLVRYHTASCHDQLLSTVSERQIVSCAIVEPGIIIWFGFLGSCVHSGAFRLQTSHSEEKRDFPRNSLCIQFRTQTSCSKGETTSRTSLSLSLTNFLSLTLSLSN